MESVPGRANSVLPGQAMTATNKTLSLRLRLMMCPQFLPDDFARGLHGTLGLGYAPPDSEDTLLRRVTAFALFDSISR
jgi:hypothetical protein